MTANRSSRPYQFPYSRDAVGDGLDRVTAVLATGAQLVDEQCQGDTVFGLHCTAGTVRGWRRPMANTQIVPTVAVAAIGIMASGKLPVSAWIQPTR
jgi:hypothetical protein